MNLLVELALFGVLVPALIALAAYLAFLKASTAASPWAPPLAVAIGVFATYAFCPPWDSLVPHRHWQWLPYLALASGIVGPLAIARRASVMQRSLVFAALAIAAASLIVPKWETLAPSRPISIALLAAYLLALMAALDALPKRLLGPQFLVEQILVAFALAGLLAVAVSVKYGQLAAITGGTLAGVALAARLTKSSAGGRTLIPTFVILTAGLAYVGAIELDHPRWGFLLLPAAPIALWCCAVGPMNRLTGIAAASLRAIAVITVLAIAVGCVVATLTD